MKRGLDILLSSAALIVLMPALVAISIIILIDSGWPPVFVQSRVGLHGRPFRLWKFRTMVRDAELRKADLLVHNEAPFPAFKLRNDPRVTRLGRTLRRTSLDELPQLINVLMGDMSIVGPRPALPDEVACYTAAQRERLFARPGITGPWQVRHRHRSVSTFDDWVELDVTYIQSWSIKRDLELMLATIPAVLRLSGH